MPQYVESTGSTAGIADEIPSSGNTTVDSFLGIVLAGGATVIILIGLWKKWVGPLVREKVVQPIQALQKDTREVKYEVKNSHATNLRHELDDRHNESMKAITKIGDAVDRLVDQVDELHQKTDRMKARAEHTHKDIKNIRDEIDNHDEVHVNLREHDNRMEKRIDEVSNDIRNISRKLDK